VGRLRSRHAGGHLGRRGEEDFQASKGLAAALITQTARDARYRLHYDNLSADLDGQMRRLAGQLAMTAPEEAWSALVRAATFENMRGNADTLVPTSGIFKNNTAFFLRGTSGAGREILSDEELAAYYARVAQLAPPPDMLTWLHSSHQGL
jgi:Sulfotransferase domain